MRNVLKIAAALTATTLFASAAPALVTITVQQVGANVVSNAMGTIDTTGLVLSNAGNGIAEVGGSSALIINGSGHYNIYKGITGPAAFGTGTLAFANTASGIVFGIQGSDYIFLPTNYASGGSISSSGTYNNKTIAALGLTTGTYSFSLPHDSILVTIGNASPAPEPATWAMMVVGFGVISCGMRRRRAIVSVG